MDSSNCYEIAIIGGGLAGLTAAHELAKYTDRICLIERQSFPHHKVCGEYVSNEVLPYLQSLGVDPFDAGAVAIDRFTLNDHRGRKVEAKLPLGGFGISRYRLDKLLYTSLPSEVTCLVDTVQGVQREGDEYRIELARSTASIRARLVIGAFGKRSNLDRPLGINGAMQRSSWMAVKGHYRFPFPDDLVELHTFNGGYCGLSRVENEVVNACYLVNSSVFKSAGGNPEAFKRKLSQGTSALGRFFSEAKPVFERSLTIAQINFRPKRPVVNGIFMLGDSAGLIHPLCGNGMAMAIGSARLFGQSYTEDTDRATLERNYSRAWYRNYNSRLKAGRWLQKLLLSPGMGNLAMGLGHRLPSAVPAIIRRTHGKTTV